MLFYDVFIFSFQSKSHDQMILLAVFCTVLVRIWILRRSKIDSGIMDPSNILPFTTKTPWI